MKKNKIVKSLVCFFSSGLVGCSVSPIIVETATKVPLIDIGAVVDSAPVQQLSAHADVPQKNLSLHQSRASQELAIYQRARLTEEKLRSISLELELLELDNERIRRKTRIMAKRKAQASMSLASRDKTHFAHSSRKHESIVPAMSSMLSSSYEDLAAARLSIDVALQGLESMASDDKAGAGQTSSDLLKFNSAVKTLKRDRQVQPALPKEKALYHVVYVFKEKHEWQGFWSALEASVISDKWRGQNAVKGIFFIYVGAYGREFLADRRQKNLAQKVGRTPEIVVSGSSQALAYISNAFRG